MPSNLYKQAVVHMCIKNYHYEQSWLIESDFEPVLIFGILDKINAQKRSWVTLKKKRLNIKPRIETLEKVKLRWNVIQPRYVT